MYSYSVQSALPSGETFAIEWDDDTIHATCGPLSRHDRWMAITNPAGLPDWNFDTREDGGFVDHGEWGFPVVTFDPATGETYLDRQHTEVIEAAS